MTFLGMNQEEMNLNNFANTSFSSTSNTNFLNSFPNEREPLQNYPQIFIPEMVIFKDKIKTWFINLTIMQRIETLTIFNEKLASLFINIQAATFNKINSTVALLGSELHLGKNSPVMSIVFKENNHSLNEIKENSLQSLQDGLQFDTSILVKETMITKLGPNYNGITVSKFLVSDPEGFLKMLELEIQQKLFTSFFYINNCTNEIFCMPDYFKVDAYHSLKSWIASLFESLIAHRFFSFISYGETGCLFFSNIDFSGLYRTLMVEIDELIQNWAKLKSQERNYFLNKLIEEKFEPTISNSKSTIYINYQAGRLKFKVEEYRDAKSILFYYGLYGDPEYFIRMITLMPLKLMYTPFPQLCSFLCKIIKDTLISTTSIGQAFANSSLFNYDNHSDIFDESNQNFRHTLEEKIQLKENIEKNQYFSLVENYFGSISEAQLLAPNSLSSSRKESEIDNKPGSNIIDNPNKQIEEGKLIITEDEAKIEKENKLINETKIDKSDLLQSNEEPGKRSIDILEEKYQNPVKFLRNNEQNSIIEQGTEFTNNKGPLKSPDKLMPATLSIDNQIGLKDYSKKGKVNERYYASPIPENRIFNEEQKADSAGSKPGFNSIHQEESEENIGFQFRKNMSTNPYGFQDKIKNFHERRSQYYSKGGIVYVPKVKTQERIVSDFNSEGRKSFIEDENFFIKLNDEINEEIRKNTKFQGEFLPFKENITQFIGLLVKNFFKEIKNNDSSDISINIYGSHATGLALETSDIDLAISGLELEDKNELLSYLKQIEEYIRKNQIITNTIIIPASVPVLKIVINIQELSKQIGKDCKNLNISNNLFKIDLTFSDFKTTSNFNMSPVKIGLMCPTLIREMLNSQIYLRGVILVIKRLLYIKKHNIPYHGGLSSYALILMISAFMNNTLLDDSARYLYHFLEYFGNQFNYKITAIAPKNLEMTFCENENATSSIIIYDPLNPTNNISQSSFKYNEIQERFKKSFETLNKFKGEFRNSNIVKSILEEIYNED